MARLDPLLKTLQVRPSPPEGLVQAYLIHISDRSDTNFKKILDLKGVRKSEQASLVELFNIHQNSKSNEQLVQNSPFMTPLMNSSSVGGLGISSVGSVTSNGVLQSKDLAGFGEKLFSAARDGVGSPLGEDAKNVVEGNLKSIGKFFRRDVSGFGRFGGGRGGGSGNGNVDETIR